MSKPIVLCDIPGFGLSNSWKGNAIASADLKSFNYLKENYSNNIISPLRILDAPLFDGKELYLETLFSGVPARSKRELINDEILKDGLFDNAVLNSSINEAIKSNSAIHLIGNLGSSSNEYGDINFLIALLNIIKKKNIFRVYIHLILDNSEGLSFDKILEKLNLLSLKIENIGLGEIATICGAKYLKNWDQSRLEYNNFCKGIKSIIQGRGNIYLTPAQAISQNQSKLSSPEQLAPSVIAHKGRPIGLFSDLDCAIFFNHNNEHITNFISSLISGNRNEFSIPKFLNVLTFFDYMMPRKDGVKIILSKPHIETLIDILAGNNLSQNYISDSNALLELKSLLDRLRLSNDIEQSIYPVTSVRGHIDDPRPVLTELFRHAANSAGSGRDFTFLLIPSLDLIASSGNFNKTVNVLRIIDEYLAILAKKISSFDGTLIITSEYGNAEKMVHRNQYEYLNHRTLSPTPFLIISNGTEVKFKSGIEKEAMCDIIRRKNNLTDIAPTILGLLNIPIPNSMTGVSLIGANRN